MAIHILGNGPSLKVFVRDSFPSSDVFVGCNFSDPALRLDYTSLIDVRAIKALLKGTRPAAPVLLSSRAAVYADKQSPEWRELVDGVEAIMDLCRYPSVSKNLSMNSAQHAVVYAVDTHSGHNVVHLWGMDSMWSNDMASFTDPIVGKNQRSSRVSLQVTRAWRGYWNRIFSDNRDFEFFIHGPIEVERRSASLFSAHNNVKVIIHESQ